MPEAGRPGRGASPLARALALYADESLAVRLHVHARHRLCPLRRIADHVPPHGRVLDVGCGHGLFGNLLALESASREVVGVDPMASKIAVAQRVARGLPNARYRVGSAADARADQPAGGYDAVTILDVLYLLPPPAKLALLQACRALVAAHGLLLVKTNDTTPTWKYRWARLEEKLMTTLGLTEGQGLYFFSAAENQALLAEAGFRARVVRLESRLPYPHVLFVARPVEGAA